MDRTAGLRRTVNQAYGAARLAMTLVAGLLARRWREVGATDRLAALPADGLPLDRPVAVHWDDHLVPIIEADSDDDLAVALGAVHAHLRLAQMEGMRAVAQGRLAELLGPAVVDIDHALRCLGLSRAVPQIVALLPAATHRWLERFVAGINHVAARAPPPPEWRLLHLACRPWSVTDVVAVGRLAAADLNWMVLFQALRIYGGPEWPDAWRGLLGALEGPDVEDAVDLATRFTHSGSNALAVAGRRRGGGGAIVAGDPHLDMMLPNFWLAGGLRSPTLHAVGLMIPGLPFIAIGRNRRIAWSGTCLHAASTELFDATGLAAVVRHEPCMPRWAPPGRLPVRETALGPLISDIRPLAGGGRPVALHWMGHQPSDEFTAMLAINRAADWRQFAAAAAAMAVPGQVLIYGDADGHIGKCLAVRLPRRPPGPPADLLAPPEDLRYWRDSVSARDLPVSFDPPEGVVVSANLPPEEAPVAVSHFHSPPYREQRMASLLGGRSPVSVADVEALQRDVMSEPALALRDHLLGYAGPAAGALGAALRAWDGRYDEESTGAAAYELLLYHVARLTEGRTMARRLAAGWWDASTVVRSRLTALSPAAAGILVRRALAQAQRTFGPGRRWGELHRLDLPHALGHLPLLGRAFRWGGLPWPGGNETLMKAAHRLAPGRRPIRYGADARFISDLSDPDGTRVVLLGGQDGWLGSAAFIDQVALWRRGGYLTLPLTDEGVRRRFPHRMVLRP